MSEEEYRAEKIHEFRQTFELPRAERNAQLLHELRVLELGGPQWVPEWSPSPRPPGLRTRLGWRLIALGRWLTGPDTEATSGDGGRQIWVR